MDKPILTSESDQELRSHLLTDDEALRLETLHPGAVRIIATSRYRARLLVNGTTWEFALTSVSGEMQLVVRTPGIRSLVPRTLWNLAWHRVAEQMLALRRGHAEYGRAKKPFNVTGERQGDA